MQTQQYIAQTSGASLVILENDQIRVCALDTRSEWTIGRYDPDEPNVPDILFTSMIVSRTHGWIQNIDNQWYFVDNPKNYNGTFHNGVKIPRPKTKSRTPILLENGDVLRVDNEDLNHVSSQGVLMLFTTGAIKGTWTTYNLGHQTIIIGRDETCNIVEPLPYMSARHAKISYVNGSYYLSDCNSRAGTFLNGKEVKSSTRLREKDYISLCDCNYFFLGDKLLYARRNRKKEQSALRMTRPCERPVVLSANVQSKKVKVKVASKIPFVNVKQDKELLHDIQLDVREGTLVAVLGTAGAGKSTLMGCLSGLDQSGVTGSVIYRGVDLVKNLNQIKYLIGNVPQEKVIRPELTPEQAFQESAELRLSAETTKEQIRQRVEETLKLLSMTKVRDTLNSRLSGGEQTRVNVGIDLVADRDIYFLDEPEQGLSPNLRDELYVFLRDLAHTHGKTIVAIIHDVSCIDMFDQVIFLVKANGTGRLAFSGSPDECKQHFNESSFAKIYALLEANPEKYVR